MLRWFLLISVILWVTWTDKVVYVPFKWALHDIWCIHLWGKGLISTYRKDHRVSVFLHLVHNLKLYLLQIQSSCTWFLKVSATFRTTVEDVELGFLVAGLCLGAAGSSGRHIWSSLAFPCISSYSASSILEGSSHPVLPCPLLPPCSYHRVSSARSLQFVGTCVPH